MNEAQGPNQTVPQDPPMPQATTQVHQGPQAVVPTVISSTFFTWTWMVNFCPEFF